MSASAIKPVHPSSGTQAPKVGSGPPASGPGNSPPLAATGGAKVQPNATGSPVKPPVPASPSSNHTVSPTIPVSLVQEHNKAAGNIIAQPQVPLQRSPDKNKEITVGSPVVSKPTSNGVEGSENVLPTDVTVAPVEAEPEQSDLPNVQNHSESAPLPDSEDQQLGVVSTTVAEVPPQLTVGPQESPAKPDSSPSPTTVTASSPAFGNINNVVESGLDALNTSSPDLSAPELVPAVSPITVTQLPTSTTDALPTPTSVSQSFVLDTPPKLTPVQVDASKSRTEVPKPEFKVATPPRNSKRKKETKLTTEVKELDEDNDVDRKSKRQRTRTQPYQSPLPEMAFMSKQFKTAAKTDAQDKLITFYKNEFLAVRNTESGFYVCQALQNVYKGSTRINIRWLSQEKKDGRLTEVYIPDFYDKTDFDCIITNLDLKKLDKNKYQLPSVEKDRTLSILNRALDVEKGVIGNVPVTEEHPDGLDLSLYKDEAQLKKRGQTKKPAKKSSQASSESADESGENPEEVSLDSDDAKKKKPKPKMNKKVDKPKFPTKEKSKTREKDPLKIERSSERERGRDRGVAAKRRSESVSRSSAAKQTPEKKAKLVTPEKKAKTAPKSTRKSVAGSGSSENSIPTRSTKSRSGLKDTPKISSPARSKDREHTGSTTKAKGRKLPAKRGKSISD